MNIQFNLNHKITIKPTDFGVQLMADRHNIPGVPEKYYTTYKEFKSRLNPHGEITMQMHEFLDYFGNLGVSLPKYVSLNVVIHSD